jgi:hypothetical protein
MNKNNQAAEPAKSTGIPVRIDLSCIGCGAAWAPVTADFSPFEKTSERVRHRLCIDCATIMLTGADGCAENRAAAESRATIYIERLRGLPVGGTS